MPDSIKQLDIPGVCPVGFVKELSDYFDNCRLSVAPLRYGAGLKGKVGASLAYGLPCVATSTAVEGSGLLDKEQVLVADDPETFSKAVCELYGNQELWEALSDNGLEFVSNEYNRFPALYEGAHDREQFIYFLRCQHRRWFIKD